MTAPRTGSAAASAVIWRWRSADADAAASAPASRVRLRASLQALAGAAFGLACLLFWSRTVAYLAFAMAALVLLSALVSPRGLHAGLQQLFQATGRVIGRLVTWLLMAPLFYLFFLPFGKLLRRGRRDRLQRYFDAGAETYWETHAPVPTSSLERQY
jgi:hypothetical protein